MTRRHFLRNLAIGCVGFLATRRLSWTSDSRQLLAASESADIERPAIVREVNHHRFYNPFSPTGFNMSRAPDLPIGRDFDRSENRYSSYTLTD